VCGGGVANRGEREGRGGAAWQFREVVGGLLCRAAVAGRGSRGRGGSGGGGASWWGANRARGAKWWWGSCRHGVYVRTAFKKPRANQTKNITPLGFLLIQVHESRSRELRTSRAIPPI
jgi:hypothetical protein